MVIDSYFSNIVAFGEKKLKILINQNSDFKVKTYSIENVAQSILRMTLGEK